MKVIKITTAPAKDLTADRLMTGGKAAAQFMIGPDPLKELTFGIAGFGPGGRTKFHTHTGEQMHTWESKEKALLQLKKKR